MKQIFIYLLICLTYSTLCAQTLESSALGAAGGAAVVDDLRIDWTLGEVAISADPLGTGDDRFTFGFQQPWPKGRCSSLDSAELIKLYKATNGPNWTNKWDTLQPMNTWYGVVVNASGCVDSLNLYNNMLAGTLPGFGLQSVRYIGLYDNQLSGNIPSFTFPTLLGMNLSNNQLTGNVPNFNLPELRNLELSGNMLSGTLPLFDKLSQLTAFRAAGNQLSGPMPNYKLKNLQEIILDNNQISGNLFNLNLPELNTLSISSNQLNGVLVNFDSLSKLTNLFLNQNQLSGNIPSFDKLVVLQRLDLSNNQLTGTIPNFNLAALRDINLSNNQLSGVVPDLSTPMLTQLRISNNKLTVINKFTKMTMLGTSPDSFTVYTNRLTFDDILNNQTILISKGGKMDYSPQDSIFSDTLITRNAGQSLTIDLGIDAALTDNVYEWTRDFFPISLGSSNKLIFNSLKPSDRGVYYVKVTNPNAPDLTLHSRRIRLAVVCPAISSNLAKSICPGQTFTFNNQNLSAAGIYKDTLTAANGCDSIVTLTLSELIPPPADAGLNQRICAGSPVTLTATGGQTYLWDDGQTTASIQITPQTSGKKFVTVTDANGCAAKDSVQVDLNPVPDVMPETDKTYCNGDATTEILHQGSLIGTVFDGTNNTPSIGLAASGNNVVKIASFTATNTGNNPVTAILTVTPKLTQNGLTCIGKPDTFTITVNPSPKPQITGNLSFCSGKSTILTANGGNTFAWNTGGIGADLTVTSAGIYTVTASTSLGCTATATTQVTTFTPKTPSFGPSNVFVVCPGQSVTLNPGNFKQYAWSTGASTGTLTVPSTANQYTVTVTDDNNCTAVGTAGISELPQVGISIATPDTLNCAVTQITLDGSGSSSGPFISYAWSTTNGQIISGATSNKATIGKPGTYRFIVSSSLSTLCPDTATVTVVEQKQTATDAVLNLKDPSCKGLTDGSLQVGNITGGLAPFAFSLNGGTFVNTMTFNNLTPGNYSLAIRGRNGCDFVKNFSIKEGTGPQPGISDQTVCPGAAATFDGGNFAQWQWSNSSTQKTISITQPGTYTLTVTDAKGCTGTTNFSLQNHPAITAAAATTEKLTCDKGQVTLNSAGSSTGAGITYTWTTANGSIQSGANAPNAVVTKGGTYQLIVQNSQTTCADTATANVVEEGKQITGIDLQTLDVKCFADSNGQIIVAAVGTGATPFTYKLNNGTFQNSDEFNKLKPGTYTLTVHGADGCEAQAGTKIKAPGKFSVSITAPTDKLSSGSSTKLPVTVTGAQGTVTYAWEGPTLSCTNCAEPGVSPSFLSRYTVTVTDAQGCTASAFAIVDVNSDKGQDIITPDDDGINDGLEFEELNTEPAKSMNDIIIFNRWGQPVYTAKPYANEWTGKDKSGNNLPEGTYYYVLNLRDGQKDVIYGSVLLVR